MMHELATRATQILLLDDKEPIRDLVQTTRRFTGFTVESASTAPSRLALARNDAWILLVLDGNLPGIGRLRSLPRTA
jgi:DNA-binding response OmpR family regulator